MTFPRNLKLRAIELSNDGSASWVITELSREFKDMCMPTEKTITRWHNEAKRSQLKTEESAEAERKTQRELLVTNDGLYEKIMDAPQWIRNAPKK